MQVTRSDTERQGRVAYSYCRFSTPEQAKGDSQRRQVKAGKEWCRANGYDHSEETFFDKGKSGFSGKTLEEGGELKRFLSLVENGTVRPGSVLLVENFDRLSRLKPVQSYTLFLNLVNAGIGLVFTLSYDRRVITEDLLNKEPGLLQMILGECIRAHMESARKSECVSESKKEKRKRIEQGEILKHNCVPKYFSWDRDTKRYVHNQQVALVKRLVAEYLGGGSLYGIAARLNREGEKSIKRRGTWSARSVKCILQNRVLIGEYLGNKSFVEPVISVEDFNRVQVRLRQNTHDRGKPSELVNIFKGVIFCKCGRKMNVVSQSKDYRTKKKWKRRYRYFRCASVNDGIPCQRHYVAPSDMIELEFVVHCLMSDPRQTESTEISKELKRFHTDITLLQNEIDSLTQAIKSLLTLRDGRLQMPQEELAEQLAALEKERNRKKALLDEANIRLLEAEATPSQSEYLAVRKIVEAADAEEGDWDSEHRFYHLSEAESNYDEMAARIERMLLDNAIRQKLRMFIPRMISRIVVEDRYTFEVFNHAGKRIYRSMLASNDSEAEPTEPPTPPSASDPPK